MFKFHHYLSFILVNDFLIIRIGIYDIICCVRKKFLRMYETSKKQGILEKWLEEIHVN